MNILSLFDGCSCGRVALDRAGIKINKYYASEIDPYAIEIAKKNYPDTIHIGDIQRLNSGCSGYIPGSYDGRFIWKTGGDGLPDILFDCKDIDLIIGGPPCQDLSIAKQNRKGLDGEKSRFFYEYLRILKSVKPKYFLMENVASMPKIEREKIDKAILEIYPDAVCHKFNSSLVSAQQRKRLYWTNIPGIVEPKDRGILLKDIIEDIPFDDPMWKPLEEKYLSEKGRLYLREKSLALTATYDRACPRDYLKKSNRQIIIGIAQKPRGYNEGGIVYEGEKSPTLTSSKFQDNNFVVGMALRNRGEGKVPEINCSEKANSLTTVRTDSMIVTPIRVGHFGSGGQGDRLYSFHGKSVSLSANGGGRGAKTGLYTDGYYWRKLTPVECERLQTLPDGWTEGVSNSQRYKMLGNGWTVDVIAHILSFIPKK